MGAHGVTQVDFGVFPGSSHATVTVTGQAGFVAGSEVEAWIRHNTLAGAAAGSEDRVDARQ